MNQLFLRLCVVLVVALAGSSENLACTGIRLKAKDGTSVYARTMEFGFDLKSNAIIIPRSHAFVGTAPSGQPGLCWEAKYAAVGMNGLGQPLLVDGVNERGLAAGIFYFPGYAQYQQVAPSEASRSLAPWELPTWLLTNFASIDEVRSALAQVKVGSAAFPGLDLPQTVHYVVHDAQGNCLVIEYLEGELHLNNNPIGVITNAPEFDWHLKNLNNYVNLTAQNAAPVDLDGVKISQFGQGSGTLGMPGDFTPPSRFVRAVVLSQSALPGETGEEAVRQAFHVLDSFDIAKGTVRPLEHGPVSYEFTQWTAASDTRSCSYYFHSYDNRSIRRIDLLKTDLQAKQILTIPLRNREAAEDLTPVGL